MSCKVLASVHVRQYHVLNQIDQFHIYHCAFHYSRPPPSRYIYREIYHWGHAVLNFYDVGEEIQLSSSHTWHLSNDVSWTALAIYVADSIIAVSEWLFAVTDIICLRVLFWYCAFFKLPKQQSGDIGVYLSARTNIFCWQFKIFLQECSYGWSQ